MADPFNSLQDAHRELREKISLWEKTDESKKKYAGEISDLFFQNVNTVKIPVSEQNKLKNKLTELIEVKIGKMIEEWKDIPLFIDDTDIKTFISENKKDFDLKKSEDLLGKLESLKWVWDPVEIAEKRKIIADHYKDIEEKNDALKSKDQEIINLKFKLNNGKKIDDIVVVKWFQTIKHKRPLKKIEKIQKLKDEYGKINTPTKEQKLEHFKQVIAIVLNSFSFKEWGIVRSWFRRLINAFKKKDFDSIYNDLKPIMEWLDKTSETEKNSNIKKLKIILYNEIIDNYESFKTTINDKTKFEKKK